MTSHKAYKTKKVTDGILVWEEGYLDLMEEMTPDDEAKFAEFGNNEYRAKNLLSMLEELTNDDKYINDNEHNTRSINQYADEIRSICNKIINENISYELQNLNMGIAKSLWLKINTILIVKPKADIGAKVTNGHKNRGDHLDKADFQVLAKPLLEKNNNIIDKTLREKALGPYARKYLPNALRGWLREIRPENTIQVGRPKKE